MLSYEKLLVYPASIRFLRFARDLINQLPRGTSPLSDQLKRASMSVSLNIAEASGKTKGPDKRKFFSIARGSAMECGAILDVCLEFQYLTASEHRRNKELIRSIVTMLSKLSRTSAATVQEQVQAQEQD